MNRQDTIFVAGHKGLVGSAIVRSLAASGFDRILTCSREECDLTDQSAVNAWFSRQRIDHVFLAAAKAGGINANDRYRAEFIYENLAIQTNVIHAAFKHDVKRLLFLGSSCIYPRDCPQPMREDHLLTGPLEKTNEPYAVAKIAGVKMVESYNDQYGTRYLTLMPTNLYGENDNFDLSTSHVIPALIRKLHHAHSNGNSHVTAWGTGKPVREFMLADDLADACMFCMQEPHKFDMINVGSGEELSISRLAKIIADEIGYRGRIEFDPAMPDGTPRKLLDSSRIQDMGWRPKSTLRDGIRRTYRWYLDNLDQRAA